MAKKRKTTSRKRAPAVRAITVYNRPPPPMRTTSFVRAPTYFCWQPWSIHFFRMAWLRSVMWRSGSTVLKTCKKWSRPLPQLQ